MLRRGNVVLTTHLSPSGGMRVPPPAAPSEATTAVGGFGPSPPTPVVLLPLDSASGASSGATPGAAVALTAAPAPPSPPPPPHPPRRALASLGGPVALLVLVNVLFSGYTTLSSAAFSSGTSPVVFAFLRDATACCCFVPALLLCERRGARVPRPEHWGHVVALAALGVWGSQLMSALAISYLSPAVYGLLKPAVPAVTMGLAVALGMQPCNARARASQLKALGVLAAVGGAVTVVAASGEEHEAKNAALGAAYMAVQIAASSSYPLLQKHMMNAHGYSPLMLAAWAYIIGTLMIASSVAVAATDADSWRVNGAAVGGILYAGVLSSFFNYTVRN